MIFSLYTGNGHWVANVYVGMPSEPPTVIYFGERAFLRCTDDGDPAETYCEVSSCLAIGVPA